MASLEVAADMDAARALLGVVVTDEESEMTVVRRPRSGSAGLDALAALATDIVSEAAAPKHVSSDDDSESMPPPPPRRPRSVSNPEGIEKWEPRRTLVLPASILEEELAQANAASAAAASNKQQLGTSPDSVMSPIQEQLEQENLDDVELLRRARARLFEDLSEGNLRGDKGVVVLPHALPKYHEVYNKNGRIGIYTQRERAAIIARFQGKRTRRVWNKKIRYNCRKSLADSRKRVKGRFVKREACIDEDKEMVLELPDVNDPEAGFCPTEDQPFRRARRHTIT